MRFIVVLILLLMPVVAALDHSPSSSTESHASLTTEDHPSPSSDLSSPHLVVSSFQSEPSTDSQNYSEDSARTAEQALKVASTNAMSSPPIKDQRPNSHFESPSSPSDAAADSQNHSKDVVAYDVPTNTDSSSSPEDHSHAPSSDTSKSFFEASSPSSDTSSDSLNNSDDVVTTAVEANVMSSNAAPASTSTASIRTESPQSGRKWINLMYCVLSILVISNCRSIARNVRIHLHSWRLPGPWGLPIVGSIWKLRHGSHVGLVWFLEEAQKLRENGKTTITFNIFGRIYTLPIVGSSAKILLESTDLLNKGRDYDFIRPWLGEGMITSDGDGRWHEQRRLLTETFHFQRLHEYCPVVNKHSRTLVNILLQRVDHNDVIDLYPLLKNAALDIICETTMGQYLNVQRETDHQYLHAVENYNRYIQRYSSEVHMWIPFLWYLLHERTCSNYLRILKEFTNQSIQKRIEDRRAGRVENSSAFLDRLLDMEERQQITMENVEDQTNTFVFAGHDTSSTTLAWLLWCLATNQDIQRKVHEEIDRVIDAEKEEVDIRDITNLKYLDRCIKETLRVYATAPFTERAVEKDFYLDGHLIPAGSELFLSPMMLHHNSTVYENDWVFNPDRFLPENISKRHPYDYVPFAAGMRNCIGQRFALQEVKTFAAIFLRAFHVSVDDGVEMTSNTPCPEVILRPMLGCPVYVTPRQ